MVSITCLAYNHENYIADTLDGFIMQKTDFAYEILIHDDASTDRTPEIIRDYEAKYPALIKPIYQTANQYSQGVEVGRFNRERITGKYIATCEGDDFWTDPDKLQKQFDFMEQHAEYSMCFHAAYRVSADNKRLRRPVRPCIGNRIFTVEEIIAGGGDFFATNSIFFRAEFYRELPDFYRLTPTTDYPLAIHLALQGPIYYLDRFMSAYRVGVSGSWTASISSDSQKRQEHFKRIYLMLDELNSYTGFQYADVIQNRQKQYRLKILLEQGRFKEVQVGELRELYLKLDLISKLKIFIKQYCPRMAMVLKKVMLQIKVIR